VHLFFLNVTIGLLALILIWVTPRAHMFNMNFGAKPLRSYVEPNPNMNDNVVLACVFGSSLPFSYGVSLAFSRWYGGGDQWWWINFPGSLLCIVLLVGCALVQKKLDFEADLKTPPPPRNPLTEVHQVDLADNIFKAMLGLRVAISLLIMIYGAIYVNYQYTVLTEKASHWDGFEKSKVVEYMAMLTYLVFC